MYMLDTNTVIYFFKGMGNVAHNMFNHTPKEIFLPSIVLFELHVGINKSASPDKRREQLSVMLEQVNVVAFSNREAESAALIRAELEKQGTPIGPHFDRRMCPCKQYDTGDSQYKRVWKNRKAASGRLVLTENQPVIAFQKPSIGVYFQPQEV